MSKQEYENIYEQYKKMFVKEEKDMSRYKCPCGWIYDPKEHGGKPFSEWPGPCPESGTAKSKFKKMDMSEMMSLPPSKVEKLDSKTKDMELLRRGIIAEMDAVNLYEQMAANATDERIKKIMLDVAYEEKVHAGEFETLLEMIDKDYEEAEEEGEEEVEDEVGDGEEEPEEDEDEE